MKETEARIKLFARTWDRQGHSKRKRSFKQSSSLNNWDISRRREIVSWLRDYSRSYRRRPMTESMETLEWSQLRSTRTFLLTIDSTHLRCHQWKAWQHLMETLPRHQLLLLQTLVFQEMNSSRKTDSWQRGFIWRRRWELWGDNLPKRRDRLQDSLQITCLSHLLIITATAVTMVHLPMTYSTQTLVISSWNLLLD